MSQQMNYEEGIGERQSPPYQSYQAGYQDPLLHHQGRSFHREILAEERVPVNDLRLYNRDAGGARYYLRALLLRPF